MDCGLKPLASDNINKYAKKNLDFSILSRESLSKIKPNEDYVSI